MKLPTDETPGNMNGDGYLSDDYDQLEMMPAPIRDGDFSEYMWMENEEEFNSQVLRELEEEELMEQCIVAMLDDEESQQANSNSRASTANDANLSVNGLSDSVNNLSISSNGVRNSNVCSDNPDSSNSSRPFSVQDRLRRHRVPQPSLNHETSESEHKSTLNPDAKEFVPVLRSAVESKSENENIPS